MSDLEKAVGRIMKAAKAGTFSLDSTAQTVLEKQQRGDRLSASEMILVYETLEKLEETPK